MHTAFSAQYAVSRPLGKERLRTRRVPGWGGYKVSRRREEVTRLEQQQRLRRVRDNWSRGCGWRAYSSRLSRGPVGGGKKDDPLRGLELPGDGSGRRLLDKDRLLVVKMGVVQQGA